MRTAALSSAEPPINPHPLCSSVTRRPQKCVRVPNVCFEAEQILLHGKTAPGALRRLNAVLNKTRDPSDAFSRLHPTYRPTAFVARPGKLLLAADYKQLEMRLFASFSGDPTLQRELGACPQAGFRLEGLLKFNDGLCRTLGDEER